MESEVRELLVEELKDAYSAEKQALRCMQKALRMASAPALREGIQFTSNRPRCRSSGSSRRWRSCRLAPAAKSAKRCGPGRGGSAFDRRAGRQGADHGSGHCRRHAADRAL